MLGTQASGSTWLFNVVLALFEATQRSVFSASCAEATDALDRMPLNVSDAVLKSHSLDQRLMRVAHLASARLIVSTRDPRDSVVSQQERFGSTVKQATSELSKAYSTIGSLHAGLPVLRLTYEDRFMDDPLTVGMIAQFLSIEVSQDTIGAIHARLQADTVRKHIAQRLSCLPTDSVPCQDQETQWHPRHVGDGRSGKWRTHLDAASQDVVDGCLGSLASPGLWFSKPVQWSAELFETCVGEPHEPTATLPLSKSGSLFCWGPYLHLPAGRWRAIPAIRRLRANTRIWVEADVYLPWSDEQLTQALGPVGRRQSHELALDFENRDHYQPVELRLRSLVGTGSSVLFSGWSLYWLGELSG